MHIKLEFFSYITSSKLLEILIMMNCSWFDGDFYDLTKNTDNCTFLIYDFVSMVECINIFFSLSSSFNYIPTVVVIL